MGSASVFKRKPGGRPLHEGYFREAASREEAAFCLNQIFPLGADDDVGVTLRLTAAEELVALVWFAGVSHRILDLTGNDRLLAGGAVAGTAAVVEIEVVFLGELENALKGAVPIELQFGFLKNDFSHGCKANTSAWHGKQPESNNRCCVLARRHPLSHRFGMRRLLFTAFALVASLHSTARDFSVVVYNVENLFDVDGVALFDDYKQAEADDPEAYTPRKLLTKLQSIRRILQGFNDGAGPEIILFQELEADFTPDSRVQDLGAFLQEFEPLTVEAMLTDAWQDAFAGLPSHAWLLRALADEGMVGYEVAVAPAKSLDSGVAHTNAVFSRFPIRWFELHPLHQARDIIEAELDVDGSPLIVYVNHWKSGASNPEREPIRVENAKVLRELIDRRLEQDPTADILITGDLNSHYNHSLLFPELDATGINDILGSQGDELAVREMRGADLYNLWFELPPEERYSEVWRGRRGSLMHLLVTGGLYDSKGIRYVDNSFNKVQIPGTNADAFGRPLEWNAVGETGGGHTDHFPISAEFSTKPADEWQAPSRGDDAPDYEMPLGYAEVKPLHLPNGAFLARLEDAELGPYVGKIFAVRAGVAQRRPLRLEVEGTLWNAYVPDKGLFGELIEEEGILDLVVSLGFHRGKRQLVVEAIR